MAVRTENLTLLLVDIAGYTATTSRQSRDQNAAWLAAFEDTLKPQIKGFRGRIIKGLGDALLISFRTPTDAMLCAMAMLDAMHRYNQQPDIDQPIRIRVAAHLGEVRLSKGDVFGEPVNLLARIESVTPAEEIYLSETVYLAMNKAEVPAREVGSQQLPGFDFSIRIYAVNKAEYVVHGGLGETHQPYGNLRLQQQGIRAIFLRYSISLGVALAVAVLIPILLLTFFVKAENNSLPNLSVLPQVNYVTLTESVKNSPTDSNGLTHMLRLAAERAVEKLPGLYLSGAELGLSSRWELTPKIMTSDGTTSIGFDIHDRQTGRKNSWKTALQVGDEQVSVALLQEKLIEWLSRESGIRASPGAPRRIVEKGRFYSYLEADFRSRAANGYSEIKAIISLLDEILESDPSSVDSIHLRCRSYLEMAKNQYEVSAKEHAKTDCMDLAGRDGLRVPELLTIGSFHRYFNELDLARKAYQAALKINPYQSGIYAGLSSLYAEKGDVVEAERLLQQAIVLQPGHWHSLNLMATFQLGQGRYQEAAGYFEKAGQIAPRNVSIWNNLGSAYFLSGDLDKSVTAFKRSLSLREDAGTFSNLGTLYYYLGRYHDSAEHFRRAIELQPETFSLYGNLADAYRQVGQQERAVESNKKALSLVEGQLGAGDEQVLALVANYYAAVGRVVDAVKLAERLSALPNIGSDTRYLLALAWLKTGSKEKAISELGKAVQAGFSRKIVAAEPDLAALAMDPEFVRIALSN
ncbi:MAG: tetratricopeptide repeat protein [Pseudomonadota bacterium]